jgi:hypothetical protein
MLTRQDARFSQSQTSRIEAPVPFAGRTLPHRNNHAAHAKGSAEYRDVLIDDMGTGVPSAFGSCVDMPIRDRLAKAGLR